MIKPRLAKILDGLGIERRAVAEEHRLEHCAVFFLRRPGRKHAINGREPSVAQSEGSAFEPARLRPRDLLQTPGPANGPLPINVLSGFHPAPVVEVAGILVSPRPPKLNRCADPIPPFESRGRVDDLRRRHFDPEPDPAVHRPPLVVLFHGCRGEIKLEAVGIAQRLGHESPFETERAAWVHPALFNSADVLRTEAKWEQYRSRSARRSEAG